LIQLLSQTIALLGVRIIAGEIVQLMRIGGDV
jgi:hypothetical protein